MEFLATETPKFLSAELNKATKAIISAGDGINKNMRKIALTLSHVSESECFKEDGFSSVVEYAKKTFGFEKTQTYSLVKIASEYLDDTGESILTHDKGKDFSNSQIIKLFPLGVDRSIEETEKGTITANMSCREIEKIVKELTAEPAEDPETEEPDESGEEENINELFHEIKCMKDADGARFFVVDGNEIPFKSIDEVINLLKNF